MVSSRIILSLLAGSAAALPGRAGRNGVATTSAATFPACSDTIESCQCPSGTVFQSSTSYALVYADTGDLTELVSNFTNTAWFGTSPSAISGTATAPIRNLVAELEGVAVATNELLTEFTDYSGQSDQSKTTRFEDGFLMKFSVIDTPVTYTGDNGPGIIAGSWDTMDVRNVGTGQTMWVWSIDACFSANFAFSAFHESAMGNISSILQSQGKLSQATLGPFTV